MHTAHLANVSKSVTKNATFPRTGGLPCLITRQLHVCYISTVVGGLLFCISATPQPGCLFPFFHDFTTPPAKHLLLILLRAKHLQLKSNAPSYYPWLTARIIKCSYTLQYFPLPFKSHSQSAAMRPSVRRDIREECLEITLTDECYFVLTPSGAAASGIKLRIFSRVCSSAAVCTCST